MDYSLRARPDGQTEIIELRPTVVATFADEATAKRVLVFLQTEKGWRPSAPIADPDPTTAPAPAADPHPYEEYRDGPEAAPDPTPETLPAVVAPAAAAVADAGSDPTEEDWQRAFDLLASGETLSEVARSMNVPWTQLRGKWGAYRRKQQKAIAGSGQAECTLCGHRFTPSLSSLDKCARCARV